MLACVALAGIICYGTVKNINEGRSGKDSKI